jgi:multisubunit Na+/H+ antiporter MnhF subunit
MNEWLWAASALTAGLAALLVVALRGRRIDGVIALEAAGADAALIMLLLSEGTDRQPFADLAIVLAVMSFTGSIVYLRFMGGDDA